MFALYFAANDCSNAYVIEKHKNLQIRNKLYVVSKFKGSNIDYNL